MKALLELKQRGFQPSLKWVKAHIGTVGNEAADLAARVGALEISVEKYVRRSGAFFRSVIDKAMYEEWRTRWVDYPVARQTKQFYCGPSSSKAKFVLKLGRWDLSLFVSLITGHNNLNYHTSLVDGDAFSDCRLCGQERDTFFHWATNCPRLYTYRTDCFYGP